MAQHMATYNSRPPPASKQASKQRLGRCRSRLILAPIWAPMDALPPEQESRHQGHNGVARNEHETRV